MKCGKCGAETKDFGGEGRLVCLRCGFTEREQGHIQERDRRIEAAFLARAAGPGFSDEVIPSPVIWSSMELVCQAQRDIAALDAAAQGRTE